MNWDYKRVGGLRILKIGRITLMWTVSAEFTPIGSKPRRERKATYWRGYDKGFAKAMAYLGVNQ